MHKLDRIFLILILIAFVHIVQHVVSKSRALFYPGSGSAKETSITPVLAKEIRFALPNRGVFSKVSSGESDTSIRIGYARIVADPGSETPSGFAVFGFRQAGILVSEAAVPASPLIRNGRVYVDLNPPIRTGLAVANPNDRPVTLSYYFTDTDGRDFNPGTTTIPANGQIAQFLNEPPFNAANSVIGTLTFSANLDVGAVALRSYTNERSEFLITTFPVIELRPRPETALVFPHFAEGGGWSTELLLVNPSETTLNGTASFRTPGRPATTFNYSISPRCSQRIRRESTTETIRTGSVRIATAGGSRSPDGTLVLTFKRSGVTISQAGVGAVPGGSDFRIYAERSESVQTGIAVANLSTDPIAVNVELLSASGESVGSSTLPVEGDGQVAMFLNQINGLSVPSTLEGMLRLSTTSPAGIVATGLRGRNNERGDFLISSMPAISETTHPSSAKLIFPHIVDGSGYSTQFILFGGRPASAPAGTLQFSTQSGQPLGLSLR